MWPKIQRWSFSELLENANAASSMNGVVGRIGNTMPMTPKARDTYPSVRKKGRDIFCHTIIATPPGRNARFADSPPKRRFPQTPGALNFQGPMY